MSTTTATTTATVTEAKAPRIKFATKDGARSKKVLNDVKRMRDINLMSWAAIGEKLGVAPRTARRLYNERAGREGMHHGLLPGKGGRTPGAAHCSHCANPKFTSSPVVLAEAKAVGIADPKKASVDEMIALFSKALESVLASA